MEVCPAFLDETGVLSVPAREQPIYGIGLLIVQDPATVTDAFYRLHFNFASTRSTERSRLKQRISGEGRAPQLEELNILMRDTRHHEYKFSEVTSRNLQHYVDLLNVYFSYSELEFHALIVDRTDPDFSLQPWSGDAWRAYTSLACELLRRRVRRKVFVVADLQGQPKLSNERMEDAICSVPNVSGCLRASSETSVFLQITDVLLGCVQFDWREAQQQHAPGSKRAEAKRRLAAFIKSRLGVTRAEPILTRTTTFRSWEGPSLFTAWLWRRDDAIH